MLVRDFAAKVLGRLRQMRGKSYYPHFDEDAYMAPASERERLEKSATTDMARCVFSHRGRFVDKWTHYPDIYERHFSRFRGSPIKMLEIGVFRGGSLEIWREYFGRQATIFGVDINPACAERVDSPNQVRIGSQDDEAFLKRVVQEMGGIDIVLDDGSHIARHQMASFQVLWPLLEEGGMYAIEDLHTSYWPGVYEGGYKRRGTGIELIKTMIDDMHEWYHGAGSRLVAASEILSIHVYDSIVIIEKGHKKAPCRIELG